MQLNFSRRSSRPRSSHRRPWKRALLAAASVPMMIWGAQRQFKLWFTPAQAIVVLGGEIDRETFAARFAQKYDQIPVWVSSGTNPEFAEWVFLEEGGLDRDRLHLDYRAVDTVTNFTTLVNDLTASGIEKIYLVTSQPHMRRARVIGEIVLGSRGIVMEPVTVPSPMAEEPLNKSLRDGARALLWLTTGYTGADLKDKLEDEASKLRTRS